MKLPFDFGIKLIFRLIFPGFFIALGLIPLLRIGLDLGGWREGFQYAFVVLIIFAGWVITICDMYIYMLFEGRRYWPRPIIWFFKKCEQRRLDRLVRESNSADDLISHEAWFDLRNFPMNETEDYYVRYPSRLGNILTAFETYSKRAYGIDSIFYWPRVWLKVGKDTRDEIDSSQALADSTVYASFAFYFCGAVWLLFGLSRIAGHWVLYWRPSLGARFPALIETADRHLPHKLVAALIAGLFIAIAFAIYRLSLYLHVQFGELFKSIFDVHKKDLDVTAALDELNLLRSRADRLSSPVTDRDRFQVAARYLQYQRYRCARCNALLKPSEIRTHVCS